MENKLFKYYEKISLKTFFENKFPNQFETFFLLFNNKVIVDVQLLIKPLEAAIDIGNA